MNTRALLLGASALLLAVQVATADTLCYPDGKTSDGALRSLKFLSDGGASVIARKELKAVTLSGEDGDVLVLADGARRKGKVVAVQFQATIGLLSVPRKRLVAIALSADAGALALAAAAEKRTGKPTHPKIELSDAQKDARHLSLVLRNAFWDKPMAMRKQEVAETKRNYLPEIKKTLDEIDATKRTIKAKEEEREDALRDWRRAKARAREDREEGRPARRVPPRPTFNDGLENDEKTLKDAEKRKLLLAREIQLKLRRIDSRVAARRKRVAAIYARLRAAIEAGDVITKEEMIANYQAAVGPVHSEGPKQQPPDSANKDAGDHREADGPKKPKRKPERK